MIRGMLESKQNNKVVFGEDPFEKKKKKCLGFSFFIKSSKKMVT